MKNLFNRIVYVCAVFLMLMPLVSCGGGGGGTAGTGTLGIGLTDATTDLYQAIYVTIDEVQVNKQGGGEGESGWNTILTPQKTFNLLDLVNGVIADLGLAEIEAGEYGQIRLILGKQADDSNNILGVPHDDPNYLIKNDVDNTIEVLKVPSGFKTGIKIVRGFTMVADGAIELILDFDASKSIVQAGNSGQWLLKPTIKVLDTVKKAVISGTVTKEAVDEVTGADTAGDVAWLEGTMVSAQKNKSDAADPKNMVTVLGGTASTILGDYSLLLEPDTYNIVAAKSGFEPQCLVVDAPDYMDYSGNNFLLINAAASGTFSVSVTGLDTAEDSALISIRQAHSVCGVIEVASFNVKEGATSDPIILPEGTSYEVVVSAKGKETQVFVSKDSDVVADTETLLNIVFPTP